MRRSRPRKKIISVRQSGGWNKNSRASPSGPSYESFTIPTPRGFLSKEDTTSGNTAAMDMSLTGRKRPASDGEHVQEFTSLPEPRSQTAPVDINEGDSAQQSLDGSTGSARPGVKQIVVKFSGLRTATGAFNSSNHAEDKGSETKSQQETFRALWSNNAAGFPENRQNASHSMNCIHPDFQTSQYASSKQTFQILQQALQTPEEREQKEEPAETPKEDRPSPIVNGENSGGSAGHLGPITESRCVPDSRGEQARSVHDLPARSCFPQPANPNWMQTHANSCRSCPGPTFSTNSQAVASGGCNACGRGTTFTTPCSFQRGVPRAVRYYVEPASLNEIKCFPRRIEAPACCQRMEFEGAQAPMMYGAQTMKPVGGGRNMVQQQPQGGYTCGAAHYIPGGDEHVLVCPAPWVHKGRIFPGVPAMCVDQQKYEVNWAPASAAPECGSQQPKANEEHEMPDPVFPPAHHASNFAADLDMDNQRQLEEQIAHEILLLSQKLANLQGRYGARRVATDNAKPAVLSCPQTPLLLDNRDVKCNSARIAPNHQIDDTSQRPATSSSSRASHRQSESRCQVDERKLGGRYMGPSTKGAPSSASSRVSDAGTVKNHSHSRGGSFGPGKSVTTTGSRAAEAALVQRWGKVLREAGKPSNKPTRSFSKKERERELVDECSYSDDMKEHSRTGGANVQGYPDGNKRFDWVKTLRFGGVTVREDQGCADLTSQMDSKASTPIKEFTDVDAETWLRDSNEHERILPTSMSKSVQAGGNSSPDCRFDDPPRKRPDSSIGKPCCKRVGSPSEEIPGLDSRLAHHLVKAGLRRAPSFWRVPGIRPVPGGATLKMKKKAFRSRSPRKDGGKSFRRRTLFDPKPETPSDHVGAKEDKNEQSELKVETPSEAAVPDTQWRKEVEGDYEAEYETFVENTSDVGLHRNNNALDSEEFTSVVNREAHEDGPPHQPRKSPEKAEPPASVSSLTKPPPPATKRTFIRCIELVVATKKKTQVLSKLNGVRKDSGIECRRIVEPSVYGMEKERTHVIEGIACQDDTQVAKEQTVRKSKQSSKSKPKSPMALMESQSEACSKPEAVALLQIKTRQFSNPESSQSDGGPSSSTSSVLMHQVAMKPIEEGSEQSTVAAAPDCVMDLGGASSLACVLSKRMEAEQLQEIFDALEKERLELPKIRTDCRNKIGVTSRTNSPRDSGGVKRIAEQLKMGSKLQDKASKEENDVVEGGSTITKGRPHWNRIQQQKQAVVF